MADWWWKTMGQRCQSFDLRIDFAFQVLMIDHVARHPYPSQVNRPVPPIPLDLRSN
jgi:hypothetical protein